MNFNKEGVRILKLLAMYLPQFHEIKENNEWWGKGYTEWTAVKRGEPLYKGHIQPKIPLNNNYYDLSDETGEVWKWQANLANKYGIYFLINFYFFSINIYSEYFFLYLLNILLIYYLLKC